jgi:hypothetical protein
VAFEYCLSASGGRIEPDSRPRGDQSRDGLSWIEIRLKCAASIAARSKAGAASRAALGECKLRLTRNLLWLPNSSN